MSLKIKRPHSAIKYEPSGYKKHQSNECQIHMPAAIQFFTDIESLHLVSNRLSRPVSALSLRHKVNNTSVIDKPMSVLNDTRATPRYIRKDKEDLYQDVLQLQQQLNQKNEENTKQKTQICALEKEISQLTEMLKNVELFMNKKTNYISIFELKKSIQDLKQQVTAKNEELKQAKYNNKTTKLEELRIELRESHVECLRLRTLLDQHVRSQAMQQYNDHTLIEEKVYIQGQMLNSLKAENDQFIGLLKIQEEETNYYKDLLTQTLKTVRKYEECIDDMKKNLTGKNHFLDKLVSKLELLKSQNGNLADKVIKVEDCKMQIRSQEQILENQNKLIQKIQNDNEYLNGMVHELKIKNAEKTIYETKEKKLFQDQIQKIQQQYDILDEKYKNALHMMQAQSKMKETIISSVMIHKRYNEQTVQNSFQQYPLYVPKKLRVVKNDDVLDIGKQLNYRFRLKKITLSDVIEQYLFDDKDKKEGSISIKELQSRFTLEPFLLQDGDQALLLARYLIEDNSDEFVEFNIEQTESLMRVSSVFNKVVKNYKIFSLEEELKYKNEIIPIIVKYKQSLKQHFDSLISLNGDLTRKQILDTFTFMDIDLDENQLEYFFLRMFALSNHIDKFPYVKIFEIFQHVQVVQHTLTREKTLRRKVENKTAFPTTKSLFRPDDSIVYEQWVCVWNAVTFCESCAIRLSTEEALSIKKQKYLTPDEKIRLRKGGNYKFKIITFNAENKYYSNIAVTYRIELALSSTYETSTTESEDLSYQKDQYFIKDQLTKLLDQQGFREDFDWLMIQYQILNRDVRKKVDKGYIGRAFQQINQKFQDRFSSQINNKVLNNNNNDNKTMNAFRMLLQNQK